MMVVVQSAVALARRRLWRSPADAAWKDYLTAGLGLVGVAALLWLTSRLGAVQQFFLWATYLVVLAWLSRRAGARLFGPVLFYDLIRLARQNRFFLLRCGYAFALALVLYWAYIEFWDRWGFMQARLYRGQSGALAFSGSPTAAAMAELAEWFFYTFMIVQFSAVFLLTPAYTAGAISEEKDRKTIEFLLATDLHNREIVLSKLVARLGNMALIILTGLPILGIVQFLGGVDPNLVLAGFAATGLTLLSLGSFSILCSVYLRKPRDAIVLTYLGVVAYLGLATLLHETPALSGPLTDLVNTGNLYTALATLRADVEKGSDLAASISGALRSYAIFHVIFASLCVIWSVLRLRVLALKQSSGGSPRTGAPARTSKRPRLRVLPMVWKEIHIEPGLRLNLLGRAVVGLFVLLSLLPALAIVGMFALEVYVGTYAANHNPGLLWQSLGSAVNPWLRLAGCTVACLLLIAVAVRAAGSVSGERDRETLDGLLTSPLESHDILFAKWLGSLVSVRWGWLWLAVIWALGLSTAGLSLPGVCLMAIAWLVFAGTLAGVGLWFSTACHTTLRATLLTLIVTAVAALHPGLVLLFCAAPGGGGFPSFLGLFSPATAFYWLSCTQVEFHQQEIRTIGILFGLFIWSLAAVCLWTTTRRRFRMLSSRMPYRRPDAFPLIDEEFAKLLRTRTQVT